MRSLVYWIAVGVAVRVLAPYAQAYVAQHLR